MTKNLNLGDFLTISRSNISKLQIFLKNRFHSNWPSYLVLTSGQKPKKSFELFLKKNIKVSDFGLIWRPFREYLQIKNFFKNPALSLFYLYGPLTSRKKSEKLLAPFLRKLRYQPTNHLQHRSHRTSLTLIQYCACLYKRYCAGLINKPANPAKFDSYRRCANGHVFFLVCRYFGFYKTRWSYGHVILWVEVTQGKSSSCHVLWSQALWQWTYNVLVCQVISQNLVIIWSFDYTNKKLST